MGTRIITELPGPKSKILLKKMELYVAKAKVDRTLVPGIIKDAKGALITDIDGNTFIDLAGGVGVMNVGHCNPLVVEAIVNSATHFSHTDFTIIPYESYILLAEKLCSRAPGAFPKKACFLNSGAEAVESAIKIARKATGRKGIICFEGAFHGRTLMALSLTSKVKPYKDGMGPFAPDVYRVPFPYSYRWPGTPSDQEVCDQAIHHLERAFILQISAEETAAIIIEPIQGEGGFIVPPGRFLNRVQELCHKYGIILIADEVQTGYGRTGEFFASSFFGIEPDLIIVGKSIAAGLPLSGVIGRANYMDIAGDGAIGGTFVGNPIACSAALAVLNVYDQERLGEQAIRIGGIISKYLEQIAKTSSLIGEIRGVGAMIAFEMVRDKQTREPAIQETLEVIKLCLSRGVIIIKAGMYGNVIRFLVPLVITNEQLDEALDIIKQSIYEVENKTI